MQSSSYFSNLLVNFYLVDTAFATHATRFFFVKKLGAKRLRPYLLEYTGSRPITKVKHSMARSVLGWVTPGGTWCSRLHSLHLICLFILYNVFIPMMFLPGVGHSKGFLFRRTQAMNRGGSKL